MSHVLEFPTEPDVGIVVKAKKDLAGYYDADSVYQRRPI